VLGAVAGVDATSGTTTVTVGATARASTLRTTTGLPAPDVAMGSPGGVLRFQVGSDPAVEVTLDADTTLADLAAAVNALAAGVTARIVNAGTSSAPSYRLHVTSDATGEAASITVQQDDTGLGVVTDAGVNAIVSLDDLGITVERDTNTVGDLLPGLTLTLRATGTAIVTVAEDAAAAVARAGALVTAYNELRAFVAAAASITTGDDAIDVGPLAADLATRTAVQRLQEALGTAGPGGRTVADFGITTARDGTLRLDETTLRDALGADADGVAGTLASAAAAMADLVDDLTATGGLFALRTAALDQRARRLDASIVAAERRVDQVEATLRRQFQALETLLASLEKQSQGLAAILPLSES
jgi:flagellar hook-associated protein 2